MRSAIILVISALSTGTLAGYNCKCQDDRGQFNAATEACCKLWGGLIGYYPGPNNQCANALNGIDSGNFVKCCQSFGVGTAYCWK
ncbi:hypothetical protein QBC38DRAFT_378273 [Podospora fimiseda]|uniref:Uncharacterized protein n=1 Tax=Podospora fimiseda TaxID=252190 RepID=A0AAN6YK93_9PEZI|nr:hypothetical protein QBC38DRAFT_378273 [Podospora fimiseda]